MGANPIFFHANDDEWVTAAGFDPKTFPETETVGEFLNRMQWHEQAHIIQDLKEHGFLSLVRYYSLEERFEKYEVSIAKDEKLNDNEAWFYGTTDVEYERKITLSNGTVLKEVRDNEKENELWTSGNYEEGYDFLFCFRVKRIVG